MLKRILASLAGGATALAATALAVNRAARRTEATHPADGAFVTVRNVRLHYTDTGSGAPIVLIHGNGVTAFDWRTSGVIDELARTNRVIAFDRPGFGYSERPRRTLWTASAQAALVHEALAALGITGAVIVGHSWGTMVAVALALDHPQDARAVVLVSGYYYPSVRLDVPIAGAPAIPVAGDLMRYTISPVIGRALAPLIVKQLFAPLPVSDRFARFPLGMSLRPSQLRASAEDSVLMIPSAMMSAGRYGELRMPVTILAGRGDKIISANAQSERLRTQIPNVRGRTIDGVGHMLHYGATEHVRDAILAAAPAEASAAV